MKPCLLGWFCLLTPFAVLSGCSNEEIEPPVKPGSHIQDSVLGVSKQEVSASTTSDPTTETKEAIKTVEEPAP